jgi:hypothetical protein
VLSLNGAQMDGGGDLRSTIKKWNVIYPVYLNSKKTVAEGRRIAASKACPDPTCIEIADCCSHLKIPHAIEVSGSSLLYLLRFLFHLGLSTFILLWFAHLMGVRVWIYYAV